MTILVALRWAELGSIVSLLVLWSALATLLTAIVRRSRAERDPPRGL
jgi:hypothetical protein